MENLFLCGSVRHQLTQGSRATMTQNPQRSWRRCPWHSSRSKCPWARQKKNTQKKQSQLHVVAAIKKKKKKACYDLLKLMQRWRKRHECKALILDSASQESQNSDYLFTLSPLKCILGGFSFHCIALNIQTKTEHKCEKKNNTFKKKSTSQCHVADSCTATEVNHQTHLRGNRPCAGDEDKKKITTMGFAFI